MLQLLDYQKRIDWEWPQGRLQYAEFDKTIDDCLDYAQCEEACPQNLPVRKLLQEAKDRLGQPV